MDRLFSHCEYLQAPEMAKTYGLNVWTAGSGQYASEQMTSRKCP